MDVNRFYFEQYTSVEKHYAEEIEVACPSAYVRVRYTYHGVPKGEREPRIEDGKAIFMLKRQPDGSWLATHLMRNNNIPPE